MFDLPEQYVGGGVFTNYLHSFSATQTAINEQAMQMHLSQFDPSQLAALEKRILALEKQKGDPLDRIKKEADSTQRYYLSAQSSARVEAQRDKATITRLTKAQEKEVGKFDEKVDKIIAPKNITKLAKIMADTAKEPRFEKIENAESLQAEVLSYIQNNPDKADNISKSVKKYIGAFDEKPLQEEGGEVQAIKDLPGVSQAQMADIYISYYGLGQKDQDTKKVEQLKDYGSTIVKSKYGLELREAKGGPRTDARFSTAQRLAGETWADYATGIKARDKDLQAEIDKLTLQRDELALKQAQMASGELDPYQFYLDRGVRNPALGTVRLAPGQKPKLRTEKPSPMPPMDASFEATPIGAVRAGDYIDAEEIQTKSTGADLFEIPDDPGPDDTEALNQMLMQELYALQDKQRGEIKERERLEQERKLYGEFDPDAPDPFRAERRPPYEKAGIPGSYAYGTRMPTVRPRPSDEEMRRAIQEQQRYGSLDPDVPDPARGYRAVPMPNMGGESTAVPMPTTWAYGTRTRPVPKTMPTREQLLSDLQQQEEFRSIVEDEDDMGIINAMPGSLEPRIEGPFPSFIEAQKHQAKFRGQLRNYEVGQQEGQFYLIPPGFGEQLVDPTGFQP